MEMAKLLLHLLHLSSTRTEAEVWMEGRRRRGLVGGLEGAQPLLGGLSGDMTSPLLGGLSGDMTSPLLGGLSGDIRSRRAKAGRHLVPSHDYQP